MEMMKVDMQENHEKKRRKTGVKVSFCSEIGKSKVTLEDIFLKSKI